VSVPEPSTYPPPGANGSLSGSSGVAVLTVDDQAACRRAVAAVLDATPGFHAIGEADSGEAALEAVQRLCPDLVLLDVRMPGICGIETARRLSSSHSDVVVVLVSADSAADLPADASTSGAAAVVRKQDVAPALLAGLWAAHGRR
jgi:two-component system invasion response regulator UvrY